MVASAPVGVLALQGAFARHLAMLAQIGVPAVAVRDRATLEQVRGLVLPGGESTTMERLLDSADLRDLLAERLADGLPVFGTCAGMILLAKEVRDGRPDQRPFAAIDIAVRRNGYGRQIRSFESDLVFVDAPGDAPMPAVFIRAPRVERAGEAVERLAMVDDAPVVCRQGGVLVASFHPELTADDRLHRRFADML